MNPSPRFAPAVSIALVACLGGTVSCSSDEESEQEPTASEEAAGPGRAAVQDEEEVEYTKATLAGLTSEEIWAIGVERFHWDLAGPPDGKTRDALVEWFLMEESILGLGDWPYVDE